MDSAKNYRQMWAAPYPSKVLSVNAIGLSAFNHLLVQLYW